MAGGALSDLGPYAYALLAVVPQPSRGDGLSVPPGIVTPFPCPVAARARFRRRLGPVPPSPPPSASSKRTVAPSRGRCSRRSIETTPPERCAVLHGSHGYITIHPPISVIRYKSGQPYWTAATKRRSSHTRRTKSRGACETGYSRATSSRSTRRSCRCRCACARAPGASPRASKSERS